jgi:feruloyl esterase
MQTWVGQMAHKDEGAMIPGSKATLLKNAVLQACDALDGVKDGVLEDPRSCKFDAKALACTSGDGPSCLTAPQVELAQKIYQGPTDRNGRQLFPGLEHGTEAGWSGAGLAGPRPMSLAVETFSHLTFQDPKWDFRTFDFERDVALADKAIGEKMNSIDPNLKPFFDHGGKLLMYHGWADPGIPPRNSVNYYTSVVNKLGKPKTADSIRLFMVPGMGHCSGGDGTSTFDKIGPLDQWVEKGKAPDQIVASRVRNGTADRTRPLCAYPQVATYKGSGSTDEAASFVCK